MSTSQELKDRFSAGKTPSTEDYGALIDSIPAGVTVDSVISSTSINPVRNNSLYNELRITETVSRTVDTVEISGDTQPREILVLDSDEFYQATFNEAGGSSSTLTTYILPDTLQEDKAYKILNSSDRTFCAEASGTYLLYFCDSTVSSSASQPKVARYDSEGAEEGKIDTNYPDTSYWNLINFSDYVHNEDTGEGGYVTDEDASEYDWYHSEAVEGQTTITESITKSLKEKIQELEARVAALEG